MVVKRIAALLAAVALVVGAVMFRRQLDDDTASGSTPAGPDSTAADADWTVACISDFADACRAIDAERDDFVIRIEDWSTTAASYANGDGPDAWITISPLAALGNLTVSEPAASTAVMVAVRTDRLATVTAACADADLWQCVGASSGESWTELGGPASWGRVLPGFGDPTTQAIGALTFANSNAGLFGTEEFASGDIGASDEHDAWFRRIVRAVPEAALADPLALLLQRASAVNVVATTQAALDEIPDARASEIGSLAPTPIGRLDAVVATADEDVDARGIADDLADALQAIGWTTPQTGPDGLPSAATVVLLRNNWQEART